MRKWILVAVVMAVVGVMAVPFVANAASSVNIAITAQGSEVSVTCNQTTWDAGTLSASENSTTAINWGRVTNDGGAEAVDVSIHGHDMTGGVVTWTLSDTGAAGDAIIGMMCGLDDADDLYDIVIKKNVAYNFLAEEIATDAYEDFGLCLYSPTLNVGNEAMTMSDSGLVLTGSID